MALICLLVSSFSSQAQLSKFQIKGMYFQWGYNREWYTKSNIHVRMSNGNDFVLHNVMADDKPDFDAIINNPTEISIPQYNYRIGFYLNAKKTKAIELNFDHSKYVVRDFQTAHVKGTINGTSVEADSILNPEHFLHIEHTDGANWLHINYVEQKLVLQKKNKKPLINFIYKVGAGINIPRTDFTWKSERYNNQFHIAGYNISAEAGSRFYFLNHLFIEGTAKTGFVKYLNALANTDSMKGNRIRHHFGYFELIGTLGLDVMF